jgi:hypothetical protein
MELERITIESAENGFMVSCQMAPPKPKKPSKGEPQFPSYQEPERYVYESAGAVLKKIGQMLGGLKKEKSERTLETIGSAPPPRAA